MPHLPDDKCEVGHTAKIKKNTAIFVQMPENELDFNDFWLLTTKSIASARTNVLEKIARNI